MSDQPLVRRSLRLRYVVLAAVLASLFVFEASAQNALDAKTPPGQAAGAPAGSYDLSDFENVNFFNGHLNFHLPLLKVDGRGGVGYGSGLAIEQRWTVDHDSSGVYHFPMYNWWTGLRPGYGPGVLQGRQMSEGCVEGYSLTQGTTRLTFTASDGTEYELRDQIYGGQVASSNCSPFDPQAPGTSRGTIFVTADGSAATFTSDSIIYDHTYTPSGPRVITPSGYLALRDGTQYRIDSGKVSWMRDRNGNKISFTYEGSWMSWRVTSATDSLSRQITYQYNYSDPTYGVCDRIIFKGVAGAERIVRIFRTSLSNALISGESIATYYNLFPTLNGSSSTYHNPDVVSSVRLPDNRNYQFRYNRYGELCRVELPTGGRFEYSWTQFSPGWGPLPEINRRVTERRSYTESGSLASRSTYGSFVGDGFGTQGTVQADHLDFAGGLLSREKHYFHGHPFSYTTAGQFDLSNPIEGREFKTEFFHSNGTTILSRIENSWTTCATLVGTAINPCVSQTITTLEPATANLVSKQTFSYDSYNNQTNVYEYGLGPGAAGSLVRRTQTDYLTTNPVYGTNYATTANIHIRTLPKEVQIYDGGGVKRARTTFEYDNYTTDANHAALVNRTGISGLCTTFDNAGICSNVDPAAYKTRGNVTRVISYTNAAAGTGEIGVSSQYDIAGNVVKSIDARGFATEFSFGDCYGSPDGNAQNCSAPPSLGAEISYAFATVVTNALSHITYSQFDYYSGQPVDAKDANGFVSSLYYNDALDRLTQVRRAVSTGVSNQTTFDYDDANRIITTSSDRDSFGDNVIVSKMLYDGLGRTTETRQYEGGSNYIVTQQQYDALNRPFKTSNPFRPWQSETAVWTTRAFDALSRVTSITTPDNAVVSTSYSGNSVTVTDQAGKARKSVTDALGRLIEVYEDPSGVNYQTTYLYDVLDNLVKVTQGSQQRFFMYDSLKRLIRARNPEQGTHASLALSDSISGNSAWSFGYQYDANSNLTEKTDPRGVVSTYEYDVLNRNTTINYSDTTINPDVKRFYDGATNGKGRFWHFYSGGDYSTGANVDHTSIDSYDALGRPLVQRQLFKLNNVWSGTYQTTRAYNRAGGVISQTYPSEHSVTYNYDLAGRVADKDATNLAFTGNLGDGVQRTYARGNLYSPWGGLSREQYGTTTAAVYHKLRYNIRGQLCDVRASNVDDPTGGELGALVNYYGTPYSHCGSGTDNNGNLLMSQTIINSYYMEDRYSYDALNRLTAVNEWQNAGTHTGSQQYDYDRWGNRTIKPVSWGTGINTKQFNVDTATNRLTVPSGQSGVMSYDAAGNQITDTYTGAGAREYDAENRMTRAWGGNSQWQEYTYNADGQRVRRKINGQETWQIYGFDGELLAEYAVNGPAASPQKEYGYRNGQLLVQAVPETVWSDDAVPAGAAVAGDGESWNWVSSSPAAFSGSVAHQSNIVAGLHQHYFYAATATLTVNAGDKLMAYVYLDPSNMPSQIMLQWNDGSWEHRAYWGANNLPWGVDGTDSRRYMGPLPAAGSWVKLEVPANLVGLEGDTVHGMAFSMWGGRATWDRAGKAASMQWLIADHLGTPRMIIDQTGTLANIKRHDYLPFGEELFAPAGGRNAALGYAGGDGVRQQFTSKERDNETGSDYFLARYYSSPQGRFTSPDEFTGGPDELYDFADAASENPTFYADLHEPQSLNKYQYVYNNPLGYVDPDGHAPNDKLPTAHVTDVEAEKRWKQWQDARAEAHRGLGLYQRGGRPRGGSGGNRGNPKRDPRNWENRRGHQVYVGPGSWKYGTGRPTTARYPRFESLKDHAKRHSQLEPWQYYQQAKLHMELHQWKFNFYHDKQFKVAYVTQLGENHFMFTSTTPSGNRIFTHMPVDLPYLTNKGITLPKPKPKSK